MQLAVAHLARRIRSEVPDLKGTLEGVAADLSTAEGATIVINKYDKVDILVNNVGIFNIVEFTKISDEEWEHNFQVR